MAYFVTVRTREVKFPEICSMCAGPGPLIAMDRQFSQVTGYYVMAFSEKTTTLSFPTCHHCVRKCANLNRIAIAVIVLPVVLVCLGPMVSSDQKVVERVMSVALWAAVGCVLGGVGLLVYTARLKRTLKLVHSSKKEWIFRSGRRDYADAFAGANNSIVEEMLFYFRLS